MIRSGKCDNRLKLFYQLRVFALVVMLSKMQASYYDNVMGEEYLRESQDNLNIIIWFLLKMRYKDSIISKKMNEKTLLDGYLSWALID